MVTWQQSTDHARNTIIILLVKSKKFATPKCILIEMKFELGTILVNWITSIKNVIAIDKVGICGAP